MAAPRAHTGRMKPKFQSRVSNNVIYAEALPQDQIVYEAYVVQGFCSYPCCHYRDERISPQPPQGPGRIIGLHEAPKLFSIVQILVGHSVGARCGWWRRGMVGIPLGRLLGASAPSGPAVAKPAGLVSAKSDRPLHRLSNRRVA